MAASSNEMTSPQTVTNPLKIIVVRNDAR